ncbi:D-alanyl-D-alanine carboxypeptidase [Caldibacillus lycopersici]|uniref:serine-type D-Ala-D-Ala carboxypeptidase n=1 Tax=Perspicuibacillus lycopersici TaxID=1325689 RepID=A0AAE3LMN2_9BACI|nr:D-alanyl-D-alanine carboxypeptidase family protein [Perspicuibacillus lycopersici]MCU9613765.1 D-alanyl-D-alanine carboxypeptidase [Perspicuibacillus lycopersici]
MKRFLLVAIAAIFFYVSIQPTNSFAEESQINLADNAKSAILIEQDTGAVLFEKNSQEELPPASMTKIMTMLLIMEALDTGKISIDEKVRTSEYAASMGGSQIFLEPGEEMTVDELLRGISIGSANDASVAMAERIAGSEEAFVKMMNDKAKALGLKNTKFQNATGLPSEDHYSSAYDMAQLAKELLKYDNITKYTGLYESYLREDSDKKFWLVNTNRLVRFYSGVDGLKTGFTNDAKYCLTATAKKNGMRVIAVVFGAPTPKDRNLQITKMLDYAFSQFETKPMFQKGEVLGKAKIQKGQAKVINGITDKQISILNKKGDKLGDVQKEITFLQVKAPIKKGDPVGKVTIYKNGKVLSESDIIAEEDVDSATWWTLFKRSFGMFTKVQ